MLRSTLTRRCRSAAAGPALVADALALAALFAGALFLGFLIHGRHATAYEAVAVLAFAAGVAAAILLAAVAGLTGSGRTGRIAAAVALYAGVALLVQAAELEHPMNVWVLATSAAVLGAIGMLVLAVRTPVGRRAQRWAVTAVGGATLAVVTVIAAVAVALPGWMPPAWAVGALDVVAWSGAGAAGIVALVAGARTGRALVRRTGIAFATLSAAHAVRIIAGRQPGADPGAIDAALELTAVGMMLVAAVAFFVAVLRDLRRTADVPAPRPAVTAAPPAAAQRPDEPRDAAADLLGGITIGPVTDGIRILTPARPLTGQPADPTPGQGRIAGTPRRSFRSTANPRPGRGRPPGRRGRD